MQLTEKYRPKDWAEVAGQPDAVKTCRSLAARGAIGGRAVLFLGKSGTGKTTMANILAREMADSFGITELDGSQLTLSRLDEISYSTRCRCIGEKGGRVVIVNECHSIRDAVITRLLTILDRIPDYVLWIFTTTLAANDDLFAGTYEADPFRSRCMNVQLAQRDVTKPMAERALMIAQREGLDGGCDVKRIVKMLQEHRNNLRAVLQEIEAGALLA